MKGGNFTNHATDPQTIIDDVRIQRISDFSTGY